MKKNYDSIESCIEDMSKKITKLRDKNKVLKSEVKRKNAKIVDLRIRIDKLNEMAFSNYVQVKDMETKIGQLIGEENIDDYLCGLEFEKHVVWWMNMYFKQYALKIWQGDKAKSWFNWRCGNQLIKADWNKYPDLIFVNSAEKKVLAIECKYRTNGVLDLYRNKYEDYFHFQQDLTNYMNFSVSTYIMIGVGGESSAYPQFMYCVPLNFFDFSHGEDKVTLNMEEYYQFRVMYRKVNDTLTNYKNNIPFK